MASSKTNWSLMMMCATLEATHIPRYACQHLRYTAVVTSPETWSGHEFQEVAPQKSCYVLAVRP
jgi:hypothetical protein